MEVHFSLLLPGVLDLSVKPGQLLHPLQGGIQALAQMGPALSTEWGGEQCYSRIIISAPGRGPWNTTTLPSVANLN